MHDEIDTLDNNLTKKYLKNYVHDYVKIALAVELYLRAKFIDKGILMYIIDKSKFGELYKRQKSEPIKIDKFIEKSPIMYSEEKQRRSIDGLTEKSINFSVLLEEKKYVNYLEIDEVYVNCFDIVRRIRNNIHFLVGNITLNMDLSILYSFVNELLVEETNKKITETGMRFNEIKKIELGV